jgi:hypothetical protein
MIYFDFKNSWRYGTLHMIQLEREKKRPERVHVGAFIDAAMQQQLVQRALADDRSISSNGGSPKASPCSSSRMPVTATPSSTGAGIASSLNRRTRDPLRRVLRRTHDLVMLGRLALALRRARAVIFLFVHAEPGLVSLGWAIILCVGLLGWFLGFIPAALAKRLSNPSEGGTPPAMHL